MISFKEMIEDLLACFEDINELHSRLFSSKVSDFEKEVIECWKELCSSKFFEEHYNINDVVVTLSEGTVACVASRDDRKEETARPHEAYLTS